MEEKTTETNLVTVSLKRPIKFYAAAIYSKFKSHDVLTIKGHGNTISKTAEIVDTICRAGDARMDSFITCKSNDAIRPWIEIQLSKKI